MSSYARMLAAASAKAASRVPLLRAPLRIAYERYFTRVVSAHARLFSGVYADFKSALLAIPPDRLAGFDNKLSVRRVADDVFRIYPMDYPVMFWLTRLLPDAPMVFDWGGNIGISYYAFRKHLRYPPELTWLVGELPSVVEEGIEMARTQSAPGLCFTTSLERLCEADILLSAGTLQFIEDPFELLRSQRSLPRHILLNKIPVYAMPGAVTLQNMGPSLAPNHLFNKTEFIGNFAKLGYQKIDEWDTELSCHIPFFPEHSIPAYTGYYFSR
jgi:putative methyltransferase (TIGR04325 family)